MASHSNYRPIHPNLRNLPDEITKEIIYKKGLIGINFVKRFVGDTPNAFIEHIDHALSLNANDAIAFGADYYGGLDIDPKLCPGKAASPFFSQHNNSSQYSHFIDLLTPHYDKQLIDKICYENALNFLLRLGSWR